MWQDQNGAEVHGNRTVVVDALNYLSTFLSTSETADAAGPLYAIEAIDRRVAGVADAARGSGLTLVWVFDNGQATDEARDKWWSRRKLEVVSGERLMPAGADVLFYAALQRAGFLVLYPPDIDGDDAVALLAWKLGASVLSADRDMLRYGLPIQKIFRGFGVCKAGPTLHLDPQYQRDDDSEREERSLCELAHRLPDAPSARVLLDHWGMKEPIMCVNARKGHTKRGNADSLTGIAGNLHQDALGLVASVYHSMGISVQGVRVRLPAGVRDESGAVVDAVLKETVVLPDGSAQLRAATLSPMLAKRHLEQVAQWPEGISNRDALQRAHAVCMISAEIVDAAHHALGASDATWRDEGREYSPALRITKIYKHLARHDDRLRAAQADLAATIMERMAFVSEHGLPEVVRCEGLYDKRVRHHRGCAHGGVVFPNGIKRAEGRGKAPLCSGCVAQIAQRR